MKMSIMYSRIKTGILFFELKIRNQLGPTRKVYIEFFTGHVIDPVEMVAIIARQEHAYADERFGEAASSLSKRTVEESTRRNLLFP